MATTTTVTSNYAGKVLADIRGEAFNELDIINKGVIQLFPNVNDKLSLRKIMTTNGLVAYTCGHNPAGSVTLSEKVLQPKKLKDDFSVCKEDFRATWDEEALGASASNITFPRQLSLAIIDNKIADLHQYLGAKIWQADSSVDTELPDGLLVQFAADANVIKANNGIVPSAAAVTEANVEAELKKALSAVPVAMKNKTLNIIVSPDVYEAYQFFLTSKGISAGFGDKSFTVSFAGKPITQDAGLPANTIVIFETKNVVLATGTREDWNNIELVDEDEIGLLTGNVRGKLVLSYDIGYYNSNEIVWYLTTTAVV